MIRRHFFHMVGRLLIGTVLSTTQLLAGAVNTVFYPAAALPQDHHYLVPVVGAQTERGAAAMYGCLIKTHPFMAVGVFHFKNVSMAGVEMPYVIANASYATLSEAQNALADLRATVDFGKVTKCLDEGDSKIKAAEITSYTLIPTYASLLAQKLVVPLKHPPDFDVAELTGRTPLAPFDGIGQGAYVQNTVTASAVIHYRPMKSANESLIALNDYQARFPGVHFAVLQQGRVYYLTMAAMTSEVVIERALLEARRRGLYEFGRVDKISPTVTSAAVQDVLQVKTLVPAPKVDLPRFDTAAADAAPRILERESLLETPGDRVKRCIQQAVIDNQKLPDKPPPGVEQVSNCAGVVLTSKMLTRCVLGSDCVGPRVPVGILQSAPLIARQCLSQRLLIDEALNAGGQCASSNGTADGQACVVALRQIAAATCLSSTLDLSFVQLMQAGGIKDCLIAGETGTSCLTSDQFKVRLCAQQFAKDLCADTTKLAELTGRVSSVIDCINGGPCETVVPRFGYTAAQLNDDITKMGQAVKAALTVDPGGIEFLNGDQQKIINDFRACQVVVDTTTKEQCFVKLGLNGQEKVVYGCFAKAGNDKNLLFQCAVDSNKTVAIGVSKARCVRDASGNLSALDTEKLAGCLGMDDAEVKAAVGNASAKVDCARRQVSPLDVLEQCTDAMPASIKSALACARFAANGATVTQLADGCLSADVGDKLATANCLVSAQSDAARLACVPSILGPIDPNVQRALACAATASGSSDPTVALMACVPGAGKTVAQVAEAATCLNNASSEVEQAGCVATGLGADPKAVATVTCLAQSGGENGAMAACAAGAALPPSVAKVASCAAESSGEADFAICASGFKMNPEWRIAAECAAESGGVPIAFAGCTAGRLTIRELQKCISGQIGGDGGCFGPNNEVVKAVNTVSNDLLHGPGENNDIRVALGKVTEPLKQLVNGFVNGIQHAAEQAGNAVGGAAHWVGCRLGIGC